METKRNPRYVLIGFVVVIHHECAMVGSKTKRKSCHGAKTAHAFFCLLEVDDRSLWMPGVFDALKH